MFQGGVIRMSSHKWQFTLEGNCSVVCHTTNSYFKFATANEDVRKGHSILLREKETIDKGHMDNASLMNAYIDAVMITSNGVSTWRRTRYGTERSIMHAHNSLVGTWHLWEHGDTRRSSLTCSHRMAASIVMMVALLLVFKNIVDTMGWIGLATTFTCGIQFRLLWWETMWKQAWTFGGKTNLSSSI